MRKVKSTRFICQDTLYELGIYDQMKYMFNSLGINAFFEMKYETCPALTLEFLSSLRYKKSHGGQGILLFRIRNQEKNVTDERLGIWGGK